MLSERSYSSDSSNVAVLSSLWFGMDLRWNKKGRIIFVRTTPQCHIQYLFEASKLGSEVNGKLGRRNELVLILAEKLPLPRPVVAEGLVRAAIPCLQADRINVPTCTINPTIQAHPFTSLEFALESTVRLTLSEAVLAETITLKFAPLKPVGVAQLPRR